MSNLAADFSSRHSQSQPIGSRLGSSQQQGDDNVPQILNDAETRISVPNIQSGEPVRDVDKEKSQEGSPIKSTMVTNEQGNVSSSPGSTSVSGTSKTHRRTPSMPISAILDSPAEIKKEPAGTNQPFEENRSGRECEDNTNTSQRSPIGHNQPLPSLASTFGSTIPSQIDTKIEAGVGTVNNQQQQQQQQQHFENSHSGSGGQHSVPIPQLSSRNSEESRHSAFITQYNGAPAFSLPPVQFDPAMDRRRQNVGSQEMGTSGTTNVPIPGNSSFENIAHPPGVLPHQQHQHQPSMDSPPLRAEEAVARLKQKPNSGELEPSAFEEDKSRKRHHHHHHHHHHHNHKHYFNSPGSNPDSNNLLNGQSSHIIPPTIHPQVIVDNHDALDAVAKFPQLKLGSIIYEPTINDECLIPRLEGKENSLLQIRIPRIYLNRIDNEAVVRRKLWGTDIYTDDSDIVAAMYHCGLVKDDSKKGQNDIDKDISFNIDAKDTGDNKSDDASKKDRPDNDNVTINKPDVESNTPKDYNTSVQGSRLGSGSDSQNPKEDSKDSTKDSKQHSKSSITKLEAKNLNEEIGDCIVTVLLLPKLNQYTGSFRNDLLSRSWLTQHDGISYKIEKVEYIGNGEAESIPFLKKRRLADWNSCHQICIDEGIPFKLNAKRAKEIRERQLALSDKDGDKNSN